MSSIDWKSSWSKAWSYFAGDKSGKRREHAGDWTADWAAPLRKHRAPAVDETLDTAILSPEDAADTWFSRLRDLMVTEFGVSTGGATGQRYLLETGLLDSDRGYMYLQPHNQRGLLMERAGDGWVLARADKIVAKDTFMRAGEAWDVVRVVAPDGRLPKISSQRFRDELMPFSEYRKRLLEAIRCLD